MNSVPPQGAATLEPIFSSYGISGRSMAYAAKSLAFRARSLVSVSNKLSIGAAVGLAALPLLPHDTASGVRAGEHLPASAPIELVRARAVPITENAPADPAFQLVARRSRAKREPRPEIEEPAPQEGPSLAAPKQTAKPTPAA